MNNPIFENVELTAEVEETSAVKVAQGEVLIGSLAAFDEHGKPLVSHPLASNGALLTAITTLALSHQHIGRQVALMFVNGELKQPIIVGLIHNPLYALLDNLSVASSEEATEQDTVVFELPLPAREKRDMSSETLQVDGKYVHIVGQEEITLSCGEASITLTKAGKILLRGTYLQSRSSGVNRILGGSVQVN
ncbi:MAG: hypothetical protein EOO52_06265 [Gammaproteobacteria bacterium]|nr:MAG: hypothetical protein EOO52_06265 [Gammaproteobacteria bacterium]